ncbi:ABC transporter permease [Fundicoccus culcitae]|uniref:Autoinducer 2 import system permease protein LsrC n=1 Tax=Fundicoccus culcitae TaxID=2969821 RepID=A0ABY5P4C8_9LACT|nr:ABC transporter permease [Fundicoccus culcitae]UUX33544.1 ABC transporter permease [Fundicoccus culcitae]
MKRIIKSKEIGALLIIIILFGLVGTYNSSFLTINNIFQTINGSVVYAVVAIGMSFVLFLGEIDVSVGATLGLAATLTGLMVVEGVNYYLIFITVLALGIVIGIINGLGVTYLKIPSIIMTLGTNGIIRGMIYVVTGGRWVEGLDVEFKALSQVRIGNTITYIYIFVLVLALITYLLTKYTLFGKSFKAVGDNEEGAKLIGLPVKKTKMVAFIASGVGSSIGGILYASRVGFITPTAGSGYEMTAIAACVIGGISLAGGVGSVWGGVIGAVLMTSISRILVFVGLPSTYDSTITGLMLIVIVVTTAIVNKRSAERIRLQRLASRIE